MVRVVIALNTNLDRNKLLRQRTRVLNPLILCEHHVFKSNPIRENPNIDELNDIITKSILKTTIQQKI